MDGRGRRLPERGLLPPGTWPGVAGPDPAAGMRVISGSNAGNPFCHNEGFPVFLLYLTHAQTSVV